MKTIVEIAKRVYGDHVEFNDAQTQRLQEIEALVRADEREATINNVLQTIDELRPALVLAPFSNKDKGWAIDKIKGSIEKLKERT